MGKGGCGRSSSSLTSGQARRAATTVLRGGGSTATFHGGGGGGAAAPLLGAGAPAGDGDGKAAADDEIEWRDDAAYKYEPRHNAQPGALLPVMRLEGGAVKDGGRFLIQTMRWGLVRPGSRPAPFARSPHSQRARAPARDAPLRALAGAAFTTTHRLTPPRRPAQWRSSSKSPPTSGDAFKPGANNLRSETITSTGRGACRQSQRCSYRPQSTPGHSHDGRGGACAGILGKKHCVLISNGFFEWEEREGRPAGVFTGPKTHKQPWFVHFK